MLSGSVKLSDGSFLRSNFDFLFAFETLFCLCAPDLFLQKQCLRFETVGLSTCEMARNHSMLLFLANLHERSDCCLSEQGQLSGIRRTSFERFRMHRTGSQKSCCKSQLAISWWDKAGRQGSGGLVQGIGVRIGELKYLIII